MKKRLSLVAVFSLLAVTLASCKGKYTIEFVEKNGTELFETIEVKEGSNITLPAPTKEGLTFGGWYTDPGFDEEFTSETMPAESLILYAKWVATLTFDAKGGTECLSITNTPGSFAQLPEPTKDGFVFAGWYQDEDYTIEQKNAVPAKHTVVHAKWQVKNSNTFYPFNNWRDNDGSAYNIEKDAEGTTITATENKGEWSYAYDLINIDGTGFRVVELTFVGTKDCEAVIKLEGGDAQAVEKRVKFTGETQTETWVVKTSNISTTPGQKLMIFLNAGNKGFVKTPAAEGTQEVKFEEAPYIQIKSAALYQPQDIGVTSDTYAIHFDSNGGNAIESIYAKSGSDVKTKTPKKEGYTFAGWYTDVELTEEFDGKMPSQSTLLFAKWIITKDMIQDNFVCGDNVAEKISVEYAYENGVLTIKKTANGGEWTAIASKLTGADLAGATKATIVFKGVKDQEILFKFNDNGAYEMRVTCTGEEQTVEVELAALNDAATALLIFPGVQKAGESGVFEIKSINVNSTTPVDLAAKEFACGDNVAEKIFVSSTYTDGILTIQKHANAGSYANTASTLVGKDILGAGKLVVTLKGPKDARILVKFNNQHETWVTCTGEVQTVVIDLSTVAINQKNAAILFFPEGGKEGDAITGAKFEISELYFINESERVNDGYTTIDFVPESSEKIAIDHSITEGVLTIQKTDKAQHWTCIATTLKGDAIAEANKLFITIKGVAGERIKFKIADKWYMEKDVTIEETGKEQVVEFDFSQYRIDKNAAALMIFPNFDAVGNFGKFEITKLEFDNGVKLLANDYKVDDLTTPFVCGDNVIPRTPVNTKFENGVLTISKNAHDATAWSSAYANYLGNTLTYTTLRVIVKGPKGEQLLIKVNEQLETFVTTTGEEQVIDIDLSKLKVNKKKTALSFFPEPGKEGADIKGSEFEISTILLSNYVALDTPKISKDGLNTKFINNDEAATTVKANEDGSVSIAKKSESGDHSWSFVKTEAMGSALEGYTMVTVTISGKKDEKILVKVNDQIEKWVTIAADNTPQTEVINIDGLNINPNNAAVLFFPGAGETAKTADFTISQLVYSTYKLATDLSNTEIVSNSETETSVKVNEDGTISISKISESDAHMWAHVKTSVKGSVLEGYTKVIVTMSGKKDEQVLVKVNNKIEQWVTIAADNTPQTAVINIEDLEINADAPAIIFFPGANKAAKTAEFVISEIKLANVNNPLNLIEKETFKELDSNTYTFTKADGKLTIKKTGTGEWQFAAGTLKGADIVGYTKLTATITGKAGQKITFKINDKLEAPVEFTTDGTQTVDIYFQDLEINEAGAAMVLFINGGVKSSSEEFVISQLVFGN
jgi:uncharacterized repeat protein (TIGR02543 family)